MNDTTTNSKAHALFLATLMAIVVWMQERHSRFGAGSVVQWLTGHSLVEREPRLAVWMNETSKGCSSPMPFDEAEWWTRTQGGEKVGN